MEHDNPLSGMYALSALRLCQMGCIGPHLPFNSAVFRDLIFQNLVLSDIGAFESKFLIVLANYVERAHPRNQSVWVILEAAGQFMRRLDDLEERESLIETLTHDHMPDEEKTEKDGVVVENMNEDEFMSEEEDRVDGGGDEDEEEEEELIDTILVRIPKIGSMVY
jgi:hypothetical protein